MGIHRLIGFAGAFGGSVAEVLGSRREPRGCARILAVQKLAPAVVMGGAMVIKPAAETSLDIAFLVQAAEEAGVPDGIINVVTGDNDTGKALVSHPGVNHVVHRFGRRWP